MKEGWLIGPLCVRLVAAMMMKRGLVLSGEGNMGLSNYRVSCGVCLHGNLCNDSVH